jgi:hypothetical protein
MHTHVSRHGHHPVRHLRARLVITSVAVLAAGGAAVGVVVHRRVEAALAIAATFAHGAQVSTWEIVRPAVLPAAAWGALAVLAATLAAKAAVIHAVASSSRAVTAQIRAWLADGGELPAQPEPRLREFLHQRWLLAEGLRHHRARTAALRRAAAEARDAVREGREALERDGAGPDAARLRALRAATRAVCDSVRRFQVPPG